MLRRWFLLGIVIGCGAGLAPAARAEEFAEGFDGAETSWTVRFDAEGCRLVSQRRYPQIRWKGTASENVEVSVPRLATTVELEHELPASRVLDEGTLSLWVRSNRTGATLGLRVVFPRQTDPRTGDPLTTVIEGDTYADVDKWQQLTCRTAPRVMARKLRLLREQLRSDIDTRGAFVDRALVFWPASRGTGELFLDELTFGPVVSPGEAAPVASAAPDAPPAPQVELRLDRLQLDGRPFFPRIVPSHGESPEVFADLQFNPVWIPDAGDAELLRNLRQAGLWSIAAPPLARGPDGNVLAAEEAGLRPFGPEYDAVLFWMLGTAIAPRDRTELTGWREQVLSADVRMRRPLMADVSGLERIYSRMIPMLGVTRQTLHTSFGLQRYRDWLLDRQKLTRPGAFTWTWIQTEPSDRLADLRGRDGAPLVLEPEQIRLQTYAALAAGCRGLGFWKARPFGGTAPGERERELMLRQLNLELQLLEPWLVSGTLLAQSPLQKKLAPVAKPQQAIPPPNVIRGQAPDKDLGDELQAAIFRTDASQLLLPVWYGDQAQFVPGQLAANDLQIIVPGVDESAAAWLVSTTDVRSLDRKRVTGGIQITLPKFELTAAVIISSDLSVRDRLRQVVERIRPLSAATLVELATLKLARVRQVDAELTSMQIAQPDAPRLLSRAQSLVDRAQEGLANQDYARAREAADDACQMLRILQRAHWDTAVRRLASPVSSPHTLCFQTLPDHWRLIGRLGRANVSADDNLLGSGDFEDADTIFGEAWGHEQADLPGIRATAELYPSPQRGNYCLRLVALRAPGNAVSTAVARRPLTVTTPPVTVHSGQLVHISGWVRLVTPVAGNLDGAMLYDNIGGPDLALRWTEPGEWQRFDLLREIRSSGDLTLRMSLAGLGEVQFDDLRILAIAPSNDPPPLARDGLPVITPAGARSPLDRRRP